MSWAETPSARPMQGGRLRLVHGPIDLIVTAEGPAAAVRDAHVRARDAFGPVLHELCGELSRLRAPHGAMPSGAVAAAMVRAVAPFSTRFVTPMAAVAGAVADHVLAAMLAPGHGLARAHVNNGGDIALWTGGAPLRVAVCEDIATPAGGPRVTIGPGDGIGGVATSGWRGRSHSFGIADAVTVLAGDAATADAAATLIAGAVDLPGHPAVSRAPANSLSPDSDLDARLVTVQVGPLTRPEIRAALARGAALAEGYRARGLIRAAGLACQGRRRVVGEHVIERESIHA